MGMFDLSSMTIMDSSSCGGFRQQQKLSMFQPNNNNHNLKLKGNIRQKSRRRCDNASDPSYCNFSLLNEEIVNENTIASTATASPNMLFLNLKKDVDDNYHRKPLLTSLSSSAVDCNGLKVHIDPISHKRTTM